jgi:EAL domain-containing protein (putative c-di-GMP-specific phosphodiesterase class I)
MEAASHPGRRLENLARLRIAGFGLSIDDYGTGYASMQQLMQIAFTELKVDRSFVTGAATLPSLRVALESSLAIAKRLQLSSVAEGVEDQADLDLLRQLGCNTAQGYYIARPMDFATFLKWCRGRLADGKTSGVATSTGIQRGASSRDC